MRRKEKEITDRAEIDEILRKAEILRIAMANGNEPYIVPVNFGYEGGALFFHSAVEGRKLDIIRKNPRVCFEAETDIGLESSGVVCEWTFRYKSVIGYGKARIVAGDDEKRAALVAILRHYRKGDYEIPDAKLKGVCAVRIDVERVTGKRSAP